MCCFLHTFILEGKTDDFPSIMPNSRILLQSSRVLIVIPSLQSFLNLEETLLVFLWIFRIILNHKVNCSLEKLFFKNTLVAVILFKAVTYFLLRDMFWLSQLVLFITHLANSVGWLRIHFEFKWWTFIKRGNSAKLFCHDFSSPSPDMHWMLISYVNVTHISCDLPSLISGVRRSVQLWIYGKVKVVGLRKHHPTKSLEGYFFLPIFTGLWKPERRFIPLLSLLSRSGRGWQSPSCPDRRYFRPW